MTDSVKIFSDETLELVRIEDREGRQDSYTVGIDCEHPNRPFVDETDNPAYRLFLK